MRKVVVTGGSGRLGQFVIRDLLTHGFQVLSLDRVPPREKLCPSWLVDLRHSGDLFEALKNAYGISSSGRLSGAQSGAGRGNPQQQRFFDLQCVARRGGCKS